MCVSTKLELYIQLCLEAYTTFSLPQEYPADLQAYSVWHWGTQLRSFFANMVGIKQDFYCKKNQLQ